MVFVHVLIVLLCGSPYNCVLCVCVGAHSIVCLVYCCIMVFNVSERVRAHTVTIYLMPPLIFVILIKIPVHKRECSL